MSKHELHSVNASFIVSNGTNLSAIFDRWNFGCLLYNTCAVFARFLEKTSNTMTNLHVSILVLWGIFPVCHMVVGLMPPKILIRRLRFRGFEDCVDGI